MDNTYVISDIHGYNDTFRKLLKKIKLKKSDRLVLLGDLIDRGPDSKGVLDTVILLIEHGFNITCIMGNHEDMFLKAQNDVAAKIHWLKNGGNETLTSFLTSSIEKIPSKYFDLISTFQPYLEIDDYILVHAGINMNLDSPLQDLKSLLWLRDWERMYDKNWLGNRTVIHGHSPITKSEIENQFQNDKKVFNIDNGCFRNESGYGGLCCYNLKNKNLNFIIRF